MNFTSAIQDSQVLLATARIETFDKYGNTCEVRVLLDSASQSNYITKELCERLKLKTEPVKINVSGINHQHNLIITERAKLKFKSRLNDFNATITCLVIPKITNYQ